MTMPCGHPKTAIKKARCGAGWSLWCGECQKQAARKAIKDGTLIEFISGLPRETIERLGGTEQSHNDAGTIT